MAVGGDLRGNVGTRIRKLDEGLYDAIVLACAGLERLGLGGRIDEMLEPPAWLPAASAVWQPTLALAQGYPGRQLPSTAPHGRGARHFLARRPGAGD